MKNARFALCEFLDACCFKIFNVRACSGLQKWIMIKVLYGYEKN